jgi:hypothetical protein
MVGVPPIDPSANVLEALETAVTRQDDLREMESRYQNDMREAETRRVNELSAQKLTFDLELARVLRANQDAASTLLATQLQEVKGDLSERTAKLEQFRWESGGRSGGIGSLAGWIVSGIVLLVSVATFLLGRT